MHTAPRITELTACIPQGRDSYKILALLGITEGAGQSLTLYTNDLNGIRKVAIPDGDLDGLIRVLQELRQRRDARRARPRRHPRPTPPRRDAVAA